MDTREKIVVRARLIASGIVRYHKLDTPQEVGRWLEILTEELSCITSENAFRFSRAVIHRACRQASSAGVSLLAQPLWSLHEKETRMTSDMSGTSYQAVRCSCCSEPIPLSTLLVKPFVTESDNPNEQYRRFQVSFCDVKPAPKRAAT